MKQGNLFAVTCLTTVILAGCNNNNIKKADQTEGENETRTSTNYIVVKAQLANSSNNEPYATDGSSFISLGELRAGTSGSNPRFFTENQNKTYFVAYDDSNKFQLYSSDGTASGTSSIPLDSGSIANFANQPTTFVVSDDKAYVPKRIDNSTNTYMSVKDLISGQEHSYGGINSPSNFVETDTHVYYTGYQAATGTELRSIAKITGQISADRIDYPQLVTYDINPGTNNTSVSHMTPVGSGLYWYGHNGSQTNVYYTEGTLAGLKTARTNMPAIQTKSVPYADKLYLFGRKTYYTFVEGQQTSQIGYQLPTSQLPAGNWGDQGIETLDVKVSGNTIYALISFTNLDASEHKEFYLYTSNDGENFTPQNVGGVPKEMRILNGEAIIIRDSGNAGNGFELVKMTTRGPLVLADINNNTEQKESTFFLDQLANGTNLTQNTIVNNKLVFVGYDGTQNQFWVTDGTQAGTKVMTSAQSMGLEPTISPVPSQGGGGEIRA